MLILPIKQKWLDMIVDGVKLEEYREMKPYWATRFANYFGFITADNKIDIAFMHEYIRANGQTNTKAIYFRNGYSKNAITYSIECALTIGTGKPEWGAEKDKEYYKLLIKSIPVDTRGFIKPYV